MVVIRCNKVKLEKMKMSALTLEIKQMRKRAYAWANYLKVLCKDIFVISFKPWKKV